jgi:hypothetical protein
VRVSPCDTVTGERAGVRDCCFEHESHPLWFVAPAGLTVDVGR